MIGVIRGALCPPKPFSRNAPLIDALSVLDLVRLCRRGVGGRERDSNVGLLRRIIVHGCTAAESADGAISTERIRHHEDTSGAAGC